MQKLPGFRPPHVRHNPRPRESEALYRTARWGRLRLKVLDRDGWRCQCGCGAMLYGMDEVGAGAPNLAIVNHIRPHRGDRALFFDMDNLEAMAKGCHDSFAARREALGYDPTAGDDGWPLDPAAPLARGVGGKSSADRDASTHAIPLCVESGN